MLNAIAVFQGIISGTVTFIENENFGLNYTGNGELLNSLNLKLKGLEIGIKECYHELL